MACLKIKSWLDFNVKRHCALAATIHKIDGNHTHHSIPITIHIRIFIPLTPQTECTLELYNFCWCTLFAFSQDVFSKLLERQMHKNKSFSSERISNHCGVVIHMYIPTATNHYDFFGTVTIISSIRKNLCGLWEPKKLSLEVGPSNLIEGKVIETLTIFRAFLYSILWLDQHPTLQSRTGPVQGQNRVFPV